MISKSRTLHVAVSDPSHFVDVSDADLARFSEENENENTKRKTKSDLAIFSDYLASINERRDITLLPYGELQVQNILMKFIFWPYNKKNISRWLWKCDFYFLVLKTIFYSLAALVRKILFSPLENKSHISAPP